MKERQVNGNMTRNMDIDEAIAHAREAAERKRRAINFESEDNIDDDIKMNCLKCAEEHEQLAEWLEELKELREAEDKFKRNINFFNEINVKVRNQAIDDFKSEVKDLINNSTVIRHKDVDEIAEQLKAGITND